MLKNCNIHKIMTSSDMRTVPMNFIFVLGDTSELHRHQACWSSMADLTEYEGPMFTNQVSLGKISLGKCLSDRKTKRKLVISYYTVMANLSEKNKKIQQKTQNLYFKYRTFFSADKLAVNKNIY